VKVVIRPDFIDIEPAADGLGVIVGRVFQGTNYLYRVRLPSGATVQSEQHHNHLYPIGARVALKINPGHSMTYFIHRIESAPTPELEQATKNEKERREIC
jgi:iron(III) transport system ATP-binding protein